jgi:diaminopimelate epimerase
MPAVSPRLRFVKYQGLGNDFVLVEGPLMPAERAARLCDRRRGIGADGVVTLLPPRTPGAVATMHIYNSDGSVAAMCGNAIRCVARELHEVRGLPAELLIDTDSGPKRCIVHRGPAGPGGEAGLVEAVSVEMGPAQLQGEQDFSVAGEQLHAVRVSVGNPHAVLFDEPSPVSAEGPGPLVERAQQLGQLVERAQRYGPAIEQAVAGGVNVGFARPGPTGIDLVVWERGAGLTDACGTGACAAAVASARRGAVPTGAPVEVRLPGGALQVTVAPDLTRVTMRGPAERAFQGETEL